MLDNGKSIKIQQAKIIRHAGEWVVQKEKIKKEVKDTETVHDVFLSVQTNHDLLEQGFCDSMDEAS